MSRYVSVLDYGIGNVRSVLAAIEYSGSSGRLSRVRSEILSASHLIIPGVGAFGQGMDQLRELGHVELIREFLKLGKPILGICLGMQLAFEHGEEFGSHQGIGIVRGIVARLPKPHPECRLPNIGWNTIRVNPGCKSSLCSIFGGVDEALDRFYFVHSFVPLPSDASDVAASSNYEGIEFACAVAKDNYLGVQFHPEKSGSSGLRLLKNFLEK